jgi:hypothetical protein
MISVGLAEELRRAGLRWIPTPGDRFVLPHRGMDEDVFVLSDMTVQVHDFPDGKVIGFNGVTEWALDSVEQREALWLPHEHQLRELLGRLFTRLERTDDGWLVTLTLPEGQSQVGGGNPAEAYALAVLQVLHHLLDSEPATAEAFGRR